MRPRPQPEIDRLGYQTLKQMALILAIVLASIVILLSVAHGAPLRYDQNDGAKYDNASPAKKSVKHKTDSQNFWACLKRSHYVLSKCPASKN